MIEGNHTEHHQVACDLHSAAHQRMLAILQRKHCEAEKVKMKKPPVQACGNALLQSLLQKQLSIALLCSFSFECISAHDWQICREITFSYD